SGVKSIGIVSAEVLNSSLSSPCPFDAFAYRPGFSARSEAKTIVSPLGDQTAQNALPGANVNRELTPRARSRIQRSLFPLRVSAISNAIRSPVGEIDGSA